jgi:molybdopterin-containing oxidoreductase family molybdopterin binding subunit
MKHGCIRLDNEDVWLPTSCYMCYCSCPIKAHRVNGVVVGLEGKPESIQSQGKMCAKGKAGVMNLYNPNRVLTPLKRTNPEKGIGVDPRFEEISWEEAIRTIADRFREIRDEDPKQLWVQIWSSGANTYHLQAIFANAFGTPNVQQAQSANCGKAIHAVENIVTGGFHHEADLHYCRYLILVGTQQSFTTRTNYLHNVKDMADARVRGMKVIVIDPIGFFTAAKADEWIPIRPGTDGALALAMMNVLLNELNIYDSDFLKRRTNAPYLIMPNGLYVRDDRSKPMVWDPIDGVAKAYDDLDIKDYSLFGKYNVNGTSSCVPAFELFKDHLKKYTPEYAAPITTIPAEVIRRIAREFGEAASIGSTIQIEGKTYPYRPVAVDWARGPQGHKHGFWQSWALKLLNIIVGAIEVPGGMHGTGVAGNWPGGGWSPGLTPDGLVIGTKRDLGLFAPHGGYPSHTPSKPIKQDLEELFPLAAHAYSVYPLVIPNPERFGISYKIKASLHNLGNAFHGTWGDSKVVEEAFKSIPFVVTFNVERNEVAEMADIVLPAPAYLEDLDIACQWAILPQPTGLHERCYGIRQPVVELPPGVRYQADVLMEIAYRCGFLGDFYKLFNRAFRLEDGYTLDPSKKYRWGEMVDRIAKSLFGPESGLEWFKEKGVKSNVVTADIAYPGPSTKGRIPIYLEHFIPPVDPLRRVVKELNVKELDLDMADYVALPEWMPCDSYAPDPEGEQSLIAVNYKLPFTYGAHECENPWLNELCERSEYAYGVLINTETAKRKGIRHGDLVRIESPVATASARAFLTECIHPEVVGIAGHNGHWSKGMPISHGKGVNFNSLLTHNFSKIDSVSNAIEQCVRVNVLKEQVA